MSWRHLDVGSGSARTRSRWRSSRGYGYLVDVDELDVGDYLGTEGAGYEFVWGVDLREPSAVDRAGARRRSQPAGGRLRLVNGRPDYYVGHLTSIAALGQAVAGESARSLVRRPGRGAAACSGIGPVRRCRVASAEFPGHGRRRGGRTLPRPGSGPTVTTLGPVIGGYAVSPRRISPTATASRTAPRSLLARPRADARLEVLRCGGLVVASRGHRGRRGLAHAYRGSGARPTGGRSDVPNFLCVTVMDGAGSHVAPALPDPGRASTWGVVSSVTPPAATYVPRPLLACSTPGRERPRPGRSRPTPADLPGRRPGGGCRPARWRSPAT